MIAAGLLMLTGFGFIALGLAEPTMYDIGVLVVLVAGIGIIVKLADWMIALCD
jgi:hypothetical protein